MLIPKPIGRWLTANLPRGAIQGLQIFYGPYHQWWVRKENLRLLKVLVPHPPGLVQAGPFQGMRYADPALLGVTASKFIGSYEEELQPVLERVLQNGYSTIINVGSAEGYYTAGLALRLPGAKVYGFDTDPGCQEACRLLARMNGVLDRVLVRGTCGPQDLQPLVTSRSLLLSDCEGYEHTLVDPELAPCLRKMDILVELHDFACPGIRATIEKRFAATHQMEIVSTRERKPSSYPLLARLSEQEQRFVLDEQRGTRMEWAFLTVKKALPM